MYVVKKILCPVDFSEASTAALGTAADLAQRLSAELIVFHVAAPVLAPVAGFEEQAAYIGKLDDAHRAAAEKTLQEIVQSVSGRGIRVRPLLAVGEIVTTILSAATDEGVDLIVMSTHGRTGWHRLILGSVTEKVVRHAECPVMSIHPEEPQAD